jgi:Ca2+-binding RTX toxin-like protein
MAYFPKKWNAQEIYEAAVLATGSYIDGVYPAGWKSLNLYDLKNKKGDLLLNENSIGADGTRFYSKNDWFIDSAAAAVFISDKIPGEKRTICVSFRGTDTPDTSGYLSQIADFLDYPKILRGGHGAIDLFKPLLKALYGVYGDRVEYEFTGHSLGAAVVDQLSQYRTKYGNFQHSEMYGFASPIVSSFSTTKHFGFDNDYVYGLGRLSTKNGNFNAHTIIVNSPSDSFFEPDTNIAAHNKNNYYNSIKWISSSEFYNELHYNDYVFVLNSSSEFKVDEKYTTVTNRIFLIGTDKSDTFETTNGDDYIDTNGGNDDITAGAGNDLIYGGEGDDRIEGGIGEDSQFAQGGNDLFVFAAGDVVAGEIIDGGSVKNGETNTLTGDDDIDFRPAEIKNINAITIGVALQFHFTAAQIQQFVQDGAKFSGNGFLDIYGAGDFSGVSFGNWEGQVSIDGTTGPGTIVGTIKDDLIYGSSGADVLRGGKGNDILSGGGGADTLFGDDGDDTFNVGTGAIGGTINGGSGTDAILLLSSGLLDLSNVKVESVESLFGTAGADTINGPGSGWVTIDGKGGADILRSGSSGALFMGYGEGEQIFGGKGNDAIRINIGNSGSAFVDGGDGSDSVVIQSSGVVTGDFQLVNVEGLYLEGDGSSLSLDTETGLNYILTSIGNDDLTVELFEDSGLRIQGLGGSDSVRITLDRYDAGRHFADIDNDSSGTLSVDVSALNVGDVVYGSYYGETEMTSGVVAVRTPIFQYGDVSIVTRDYTQSPTWLFIDLDRFESDPWGSVILALNGGLEIQELVF